MPGSMHADLTKVRQALFNLLSNAAKFTDDGTIELRVARSELRVEGLNKVYGTAILVSEETCAAAGAGFEWRTVDRVAVVGRASGTLVCELLGERGQVGPDVLRARDLYQRGLDVYVRRDFEQARDLFCRAGAARPDDKAATVLATRADTLLRDPPPGTWDGTYVATTK